jgi:cysteate synthase
VPIEPDRDIEEQLRRIEQIDALVLANRTPPYAMAGGVRDALNATSGRTYAVANDDARVAAALFEEAEGVPIGPAAAVATGALIQALDASTISREDDVLLHITGNNEALVQRDAPLHSIEPVWRARQEEITEDAVLAARSMLSARCS